MHADQPVLTEAPFGSIPRRVFDRAAAETKRFSTVLILDGEFAGSGTFVKWDDQHGILTAHHVVKRFDFTSKQRLALQVEENRPHWFEMPLSCMRGVDIGVPVSDEKGPDLSVLVLPPVGIGTIKAKKYFYDISVKSQEKLEKALLDRGFFVFAGGPESKSEVLDGPLEKQLISTHAGACTGLDRRYDEGGFDFLELNVSYHPGSEALDSFAGMSGGGVWRIPLIKGLNDPIEKATFNEVLLAGVVFYETAVDGSKRRIRCHGGKSIFVNALTTLRHS